MSKIKMPAQVQLSTYDPRLLQLLEQGVVKPVHIQGDWSMRDEKDERDLETRQNDAIRQLRYMQNRLNTLRAALIKNDDPRGNLLYRTVVRVDKANIRLTVEPRDQQIDTLLAQVGERAATPEPMPDPGASLDELDALLSEDE